MPLELNKKERKKIIIDIVEQLMLEQWKKEKKKVGKYQLLKKCVERLWQPEIVEVEAVAIGTLGNVTMKSALRSWDKN